jgi:plastocyanin
VTRGPRRPLPIAAVAAALVVSIAGCGEDRDEGATTDAQAPPPRQSTTATPSVSVTETEFELQPKGLRVPKTGKVTINVRNEGAVQHALEVEGEGGEGEVETQPIAPGGTATLEFDFNEPGQYKWYCPIADHEQRGMVGKIVVAGASAGTPADGTGDKPDDRGRDDRSGGAKGGSDDDSSGTSGDDSGGGGRDSETGGAAPSDDTRGGYSPG